MTYTFNSSPDNYRQKPYVLVTADLTEALPSKASVDTVAEVEALASADFTGWQTIGKMLNDLAINAETNKIETSDGSNLKTDETLNISATDINSTTANYTALRTYLDNAPCQVLLVDPDAVANDKGIPHATEIVLDILPDFADGQLAFKITGAQNSGDLDNIFSVVTLT